MVAIALSAGTTACLLSLIPACDHDAKRGMKPCAALRECGDQCSATETGDAKHECLARCGEAAGPEALGEYADLFMCERAACWHVIDRHRRALDFDEEEVLRWTPEELAERNLEEFRMCAMWYCHETRRRCQ